MAPNASNEHAPDMSDRPVKVSLTITDGDGVIHLFWKAATSVTVGPDGVDVSLYLRASELGFLNAGSQPSSPKPGLHLLSQEARQELAREIIAEMARQIHLQGRLHP